MKAATIIAALLAFGLGWLLRFLIVRKWAWIYLNPKSVIFPAACPICLSPSNATVEEESSKHQSRNYVVAQKLEWWRATIPHCSNCTHKLFRHRIVGLILGAVSILAVILVLPPSQLSAVTLCYVLFGYPA